MAITHVKGEFFSPEHNATHRSFGFHGSANEAGPAPTRGGAPPYASSEPTRGSKMRAEPTEMGEQAPGDYARGGHVEHHPHGHQVVHSERREDGSTIHHHAHGGMTVHHADGHMTHHHHDGSPVHAAHGGGMQSHMHPHGHHVVHVEHHADGRIIHHHAHGGHTVHHKDGRLTHHHGDGAPVHAAHAGMEHMHDAEGEYVHRAKGSDMAQDKAMIKKAFVQHEDAEHHGEHEDLHLARGGMASHRTSLPHGMKPKMASHHSPVNTPPRNPNLTTTPRNMMPAGQMGYGVEPSAEPDVAGSTQGIPQMNSGGHVRHKR